MLRFARFLLVIALLAGWQNALVHPLSHVDENGQLVHLGSSGSSDASCDVLAALTVCAPQTSAVVAVSVLSDPSPVHPVGTPRAAAAPPFLSQGPPAAV